MRCWESPTQRRATTGWSLPMKSMLYCASDAVCGALGPSKTWAVDGRLVPDRNASPSSSSSMTTQWSRAVGAAAPQQLRVVSKLQKSFTFNREPPIISTSKGQPRLAFPRPTQHHHWAVIHVDEDG